MTKADSRFHCFQAVVEAQHGRDLFVTSLTGESVRIYPMPVWIEIERKLAQIRPRTLHASVSSAASTTTTGHRTRQPGSSVDPSAAP